MINALGLTPLETVYLIGIFAGIFFLSLAPYIRKLNEGDIEEWSHKYSLVMLIAFTVSTIASLIVFNTNPLEEGEPMMAFSSGLMVGLASKPTVEELLKQLSPDWFKE